MNISGVSAKLSGKDILSIINEFVKVEGLNITNVTIDEGIIVEGTFHKGLTVDFMAKAEIIKCENNKVYVKLVQAKLLKLGIFRILRSFVLKQVSKICSEYGIANNKETAIISVNTILKDVPYVNLNIEDIYVRKDTVYVEVNNVEVSIAGTLIKNTEAEEVTEEELDLEIDLSKTVKIKDNYSLGREKIKNKLSENTKKYSDYIFIIPDIASLIYRLLKDKRVPVKTKLVMSAAIGYTMFPVDILPDNIPFIGRIDDVAVVFFALNKIVKDVPLDVIVENFEGKNEILLVLTSALDFLTSFTSAANVEKLYETVSELSML